MSVKQFINRTIELSKKSITCSVNEYNPGAIGDLIESLLIKDNHKKNTSDMHKLELKTKSEDTSNNTLNLTHYSCFAKDKFLRTYNKIKDNLALIHYDSFKDNIKLTRMCIFTKLDRRLFALYLQTHRRHNEVKHNMSFNNLKKCYDSYKLYNLTN